MGSAGRPDDTVPEPDAHRTEFDPDATMLPDDSGAVEASDPEEETAANKTVAHPDAGEAWDQTVVPDAQQDAGTASVEQTCLPSMPSDFGADTDVTDVYGQSLPDQTWLETVQPVDQSVAADQGVTEEWTQQTAAPGGGSSLWGEESEEEAAIAGGRRSIVFGEAPFPDAVAEGAEGDFEVVRRLAEGGMGVVYIVRQRSLNRELVIKTLKSIGNEEARGSATQPRTAAERQHRRLFRTEAIVTAGLVHPNIIPVHDLCETPEGIPFYAMKRVHGTPWSERICQMSTDENLEIFLKVCDAVAYAHHHGVVNRDLKPENIMLGEFGEVLVLDWGLAVPTAAAREAEGKSIQFRPGAGTPSYMAPELWAGPAELIGEASDTYLLGAILFEIQTGLPPHEFPKADPGASSLALWSVIDQVVRENRIRETTEQSELLDIARKAMALYPADRHGSVLELQFAVRSYLRHEESRHLSRRADELLPTDGSTAAYADYQSAGALYAEALRMWGGNTEASSGQALVRLRYARAALTRGDYDLGLQVAEEADGDEIAVVRKQLSVAGKLRSGIKYALITAIVGVLLLSAKAIYDNGIITNLNTEVAERQAEAREALVEAGQARKSADEALMAAADARRNAEKALDDAAEAETRAAEAAKAQLVALKDAERAREAAGAAEEESRRLGLLAEAARQDAESYKAAEERAKREVERAEVALAKAEAAESAALKRQQEAIAVARQAEQEAVVSRLEVRSESIRSLTLNENYTDALRELERLLDDDLLKRLPEDAARRRREELELQRRLLMRRTLTNDVSLRAVLPAADGSLLIADDGGKLWRRKLDQAGEEWIPGEEAVAEFANPITAFCPAKSGPAYMAAGENLYEWDSTTQRATRLLSADARISAVSTADDWLCIAAEDGSLIIRSLSEAGQQSRFVLAYPTDSLCGLPNEPLLLTGTRRGGNAAEVLAWEIIVRDNRIHLERRGQLRMPSKDTFPPRTMSVSPDGRWLCIADDRSGRLVCLPARPSAAEDSFPFLHPNEATEGRSSFELLQHNRPVNHLAWSADGRRLAAASDDRTVSLWKIEELASGDPEPAGYRPELVLRGHGASVNAVAFLDRRGIWVISASADQTLRAWRTDRYREHKQQIRQQFDIALQLQSPQEFSSSQMINGATPRGGNDRRENLVRTASFVTSAARSNVDRTLQSERQRDDVHQAVIGDRPLESRRYYTTAVLAESSEEFVPSGPDISQAELTIRSEVPLNHLVDLPRQGLLLTTAADGRVRGYRANAGSGSADSENVVSPDLITSEGHDRNIRQLLKLAGESGVLVTAGYDGVVRLWQESGKSESKETGESVHATRVRQLTQIKGIGLLNSIAVTADGSRLFVTVQRSETAAGDSGVIGWVFSVQQLLHSGSQEPEFLLVGGHRKEVTASAFSNDGTLLATGDREGRLALWSAVTGELLYSGRAHARGSIVSDLVFTSTMQLVSSGLDGQLLRWKVEEAGQSDSAMPESAPVAGVQLQALEPLQRSGASIQQIVTDRSGDLLAVRSVKRDVRTDQQLPELKFFSLKKPAAAPVVTGIADRHRECTSLSCGQNPGEFLCVADEQVLAIDGRAAHVIRSYRLPGLSPEQVYCDVADEEIIYTVSGRSVTRWNLRTGEWEADFRGPFELRTADQAVVKGRHYLVAGARDLRLYEIPAEDPRSPNEFWACDRLLQPFQTTISAVCVRPRHPQVAVGTRGGELQSFEIRGPEGAAGAARLIPRSSWRLPENEAVRSLRWDISGQRLYILSSGGLWVLRESGAPELLWRPDPQQSLLCMDCRVSDRIADKTGDPAADADLPCWAIGGRNAVTGESRGWVLMPKGGALPSKLEVVCEFAGHAAGGITAVSLVPGQPRLATGGADGELILWNRADLIPGDPPRAYEVLRFLPVPHSAAITSLTAQQDGSLLTCSRDGTARRLILP